MATRQYPGLLVSVLVALLGSVVAIQAAQALEQFRFSAILRFLGLHSLTLLCIHHLDYYVSWIWNPFGWQGSKLLLAGCLRVLFDCVVLCLWLLAKAGVRRCREAMRALPSARS